MFVGLVPSLLKRVYGMKKKKEDLDPCLDQSGSDTWEDDVKSADIPSPHMNKKTHLPMCHPLIDTNRLFLFRPNWGSVSKKGRAPRYDKVNL